MIGEVELLAALHEHRDRTDVAPEGAVAVERVFMAERIDPTEATVALQVIADGREEAEGPADSPPAAYRAGLVEGFLFGARAGRAEIEPAAAALAALSYRERDVVLSRARGETNAQIAGRMRVHEERIGHIYDQAIRKLRSLRLEAS